VILDLEAGRQMKIVADDSVVEEIRRRGGAVYVWPRKDCCSGSLTLDASLLPTGRDVRLVADDRLKVFAPPGMRLPRELHLELGRKSRVRAFWDGLGWIA
jgi:hypothetical protein